MLTLAWLGNPEHVSYCKEADMVPQLSKMLGIPDLEKQISLFKKQPVPEGIVLHGAKRSSARLFIPNLYFGEEIEMGENVWVYLGEMSPAYCLFTPWE